MRALIFVLGCLIIPLTYIHARSTSGGGTYIDPSRTLKGVLKFYKEQTRVTDSESLEFESNETDDVKAVDEASVVKFSNKLNPVTTPKEPIVKNNNNVVPEIALEGEEVTTFQPSLSSDDQSSLFSNVQHLSKSDLFSDDPEEDDNDGCNEGDVTKVLCNTCVCSEGKYVCSKRDCNDLGGKPLPPRQKTSSKRKGTIKYHKTNGIEGNFQNETNSLESLENEGNYTISGENSTAVRDPTQCIDGRTKPVDCNQCICSHGKWACTKMSCIALSLREKASFSGGEFLKTVETLKEYMNIDEDCMEGEAKPLGCNQCVCHRNSWACSDFACPATDAPVTVHVEEACQTEEDVKSKDCNICSCRRGIWVCSKNDCKKFGDRYFNPISQKHASNENEQDS